MREIRIKTTDGKILEPWCSAGNKQALSLRKKLLMLADLAEQEDEPIDWLIPRVYRLLSACCSPQCEPEGNRKCSG